MLQQWRAVGNTVFDLTGPRYEPQASRSRDERVTARPTGQILFLIMPIKGGVLEDVLKDTI